MKTNIPEGYKFTEVGIIPEQWDIYTIKESVKLINGCAFKPKDWKTQGLPIIRIQNLNDPTAPYNYSKAKIDERYYVKFGDILFAWSGTKESSFGARMWLGGEAILNQHIFKVIPDNAKLTSHYTLLVLQKVQEDIERKAHGFKSSFVHVKKSDLENTKLPLPPLPEQKAIAQALSDVDTAIAELDRLITKKRNIKQGTMQQLLTGKKRLAGFSGEWEVKTFGECFEFLSTGSQSRSELSEYGNVGYIHYGDIHTKWNLVLDCDKDDIPLINKEKVKGLPLLKDGDLIIADASEDYEGVGISIEIKNVRHREIVAGLHTLLLRGNKQVIADGFKTFITTMQYVKNSLQKIATGISVYGISKTNLKNIKIILPPTIEEQKVIAQILTDMDTEIEVLEQKRNKYKGIKQGMMQELLTGRTRLI